MRMAMRMAVMAMMAIVVAVLVSVLRSVDMFLQFAVAKVQLSREAVAHKAPRGSQQESGLLCHSTQFPRSVPFHSVSFMPRNKNAAYCGISAKDKSRVYSRAI